MYLEKLNGPADIDITEENAVKGINIPFHKGAIEYYKEKGISVK